MIALTALGLCLFSVVAGLGNAPLALVVVPLIVAAVLIGIGLKLL